MSVEMILGVIFIVSLLDFLLKNDTKIKYNYLSKKNIFVIFTLFLLISVSSAEFEDTFQYHPSNDQTQGTEENMWVYTDNGQPTETDGVLVNIDATYPYNLGYYLRLGNTKAFAIHHQTTTAYPHESSYWSMLVKQNYASGVLVYNLNVDFYDFDGVSLLGYKDIKNKPTGLYEFIYSSGAIYLYIDGNLDSNLGSITPNNVPAFIRIYAYSKNGPTDVNFKFDDVSNDGYVLGLGTSNTPETYIDESDNNEIDVEWTVRAQDSYGTWNDTEVYKIIVTWLDTNTIINTSTLDNSLPFGCIAYNRSILMPVPNYGTYRFDLKKDGIIMESDYLTFLPIGDSGSLSWDQANYVPYENASVTYLYGVFDATTYRYYIKTYEINTGLVDTKTLTSIGDTVTINLDAWAAGSYYSLLSRVTKADSNEIFLAFDVFNINDEVMFNGVTYNATDGSLVKLTYVNFTQATSWYNTTSHETLAEYNLTGLSNGIEILLGAHKPTYTHENFTFTPPTSKLYEVDLYLFPTNRTLNNISMVEGMTVDYPLHQGIGLATVNIYNDTWSDTTTSNAFGYYVFNDIYVDRTSIVNETFNSSVYDSWIQLGNTTLVNGSELVSNLSDETPFVIGTDYNINLTDGTIQVLSTGNMINYTEYHIDYQKYITTAYIVNATLSGYDNSSEYEITVTLNESTVQNIILPINYLLTVNAISSASSAPILSFTSTVSSIGKSTTVGVTTYNLSWGLYTVTVASEGYYAGSTNVLLIDNETVTVTLVPISSGDSGVIYKTPHYVRFVVLSLNGTIYPGTVVTVFGNTSSIEMMNGTTGTDGAVGFQMSEDRDYRMEFVHTDFTKIIRIYPVDSLYHVYVLLPSIAIYNNLTYDLTISSTTAELIWADPSDESSLVNMTTFNMTNGSVMSYDTSVAESGTITHTYDNSSTTYCTYVTFVTADYGNVTISKCTLPAKHPIALPGLSTGFKNVMSLSVICVVALLFGRDTSDIGSLIVVGMSVILWYITWLSAPLVLLTVAGAIAVGTLLKSSRG